MARVESNQSLPYLLQSVRSITMETGESLSPEVVDAYLQRLLWEKDIVNSEGEPADVFRLKVSNGNHVSFSRTV